MVQFKIIASLDELSHFKTDVETFADIETDGFYTYTRLIQLYQPATDPLIYIIDCDIIPVESAKKFITPLWTIWQGCSYDFGTLSMTTDKFDDTLYLARSAYPQWQDFTLDNIVAQLGHNKLYEGLDKKKLQKAGFKRGAYLSNAQLKYSATDVYALSLIWQNKQFQRCRELLSYKIDILNVKYAIQYQQNGLLVDQASVRRELDALEDVIAENEKVLNGLNPNSPKQVKEALGIASSSKDVMIPLIASGNKIAKVVFEQRRLLKRRTMLNNYNYPKVITFFNPAGAATGRFTSTGGDYPNGINAQQITRNLQYLFQADTEDTVVIHADYSTAELRAGCSIMKDEAMYNELKSGMDLHKIAATLAIPKKPEEITKEERQKGKAISFGFIFGMSAPSFQEYAYLNYGVTFTAEECIDIKKKYSTKYTGINRYHKELWNNYKTTPVVTPLGRRNQARLGTDAINFATQGCIAETTKLAVHYLVTEYPGAIKCIYNVVHDAMYLRVPKGDEHIWSDRLIAAMKKGWTEMCKTPMLYYKDIPMPVECEYTDSRTGEHIVKEQ